VEVVGRLGLLHTWSGAGARVLILWEDPKAIQSLVDMTKQKYLHTFFKNIFLLFFAFFTLNFALLLHCAVSVETEKCFVVANFDEQHYKSNKTVAFSLKPQ